MGNESTISSMIESLYSEAVPIEDAVTNQEGQILINGIQANTNGSDTLLKCAGIPKSLFGRAQQDLRNRMLREFVVAQPDHFYASPMDIEGESNIVGVMPKWKFDNKIPIRALNQLDSPTFRGSPIDKSTWALQDKETFELSDSVFKVGLMFDLNIFGLHDPSVQLRLERQICTNGMTRLISAIGADFDFSVWSNLFLSWLDTVSNEFPNIQETLEHSKTIKEEPLAVITNGALSRRVPQTVIRDTPAYVQTCREGNPELTEDLINTKYGTSCVLSAVARSLPDASRNKVEATTLDYILQEAA